MAEIDPLDPYPGVRSALEGVMPKDVGSFFDLDDLTSSVLTLRESYLSAKTQPDRAEQSHRAHIEKIAKEAKKLALLLDQVRGTEELLVPINEGWQAAHSARTSMRERLLLLAINAGEVADDPLRLHALRRRHGFISDRTSLQRSIIWRAAAYWWWKFWEIPIPSGRSGPFVRFVAVLHSICKAGDLDAEALKKAIPSLRAEVGAPSPTEHMGDLG